MRWLVRLAWSALPIVVVLLILHQGREEFLPQEGLEAPVPVLLPEDGPAPTVIRLPVQHADGTPATEAVVMSSSPHFALGRADADGIVAVEMPHPGLPADLVVYALGHELERLRVESREPETLRLRRLRAIAPDEEPEAAPLPRRITVTDEDGTPLVGALVTATPPGRDQSPWLAFVEEDGVARFEDCLPGELAIEVFAPDLPPHHGNRLGAAALGPTQTNSTLRLDVAYLEVRGAAGTMLRLEHEEPRDLLPMARIPPTGELRLGPFAPGSYRLQADGFVRELELVAGSNPLRLDG